MAKVLLISDGTIQDIQIGQELTIGRAYSNLLRLEGEEISRVHGIIYRRGADYIIRDLDSKNGIFLNGAKVANSAITSGDEIRVGTYIILFDPAPGFDMQSFLRRHDVNISDDEDSSLITSANDEDTNSAQSINCPARDTSQIFFSLSEIEALSETQHSIFSTQFLTDVMRLHRQLSATGQIEDNEDEAGLYQHFLVAAVVACGADRGVIVLREESGEALRLGAIVPRDKDVAVNRVVLRAVLRKQEAVLCNDSLRDERFLKTDTIAKERIGSLIAFPLWRGDVTYGLIYCDAIDRRNAFRREHMLMLHFVARLLDLCVRRAALRH
jgi:pSer/pThr/pTyr-binding forkhead associated (FHA) protein